MEKLYLTVKSFLSYHFYDWGILQLGVLAIALTGSFLHFYLEIISFESVILFAVGFIVIVTFISVVFEVGIVKPISQSVAPKENFPIEIATQNLGVFRLSGMFQDEYENTIMWCGRFVNLGLNTESYETIEVLKKLATELTEKQNEINSKVLSHLEKELLPSINENPTGVLEKPLSPKEFAETITLENISLYPSGEYALWFDDGDLLQGHAIQVNGSLYDETIFFDTPG